MALFPATEAWKPSVTTATITSTTTLQPEYQRCAYPSKLCANPRAAKLNNKLHKLCEFHRKKANLNQQRLQQRRRMEKRWSRERGAAMNSPTAPHHFDDLRASEFGGEASFGFQDHTFSPQELKVLEFMLFGDDECAFDLDQAYR